MPRTLSRKKAVNGKVEVICHFDGYLRLKSELFKDPKNDPLCHRALNKLFGLEAIEKIKINSFLETCLIAYDSSKVYASSILNTIEKSQQKEQKEENANPDFSTSHPSPLCVLSRIEGNKKEINFNRHGNLFTGWEIVHQASGRIRLSHPVLYRNRIYCQQIENTLLNSVGVKRFKANPTTNTVLIIYDEDKVTPDKLLHILELRMQEIVQKIRRKDKPQLEFTLATTSLGLAAVGTYTMPVLLPLNAALVFYTARVSFKGALRTIFKERRIGVDILDSIVTVACLVTGQIFAAALMVWCLGIGRKILDKTTEQSRQLLTEAFGKQTNFVWLYKDGQEIEVPIGVLRPDDIIVVNTGEQIPVDGEVTSGDAMVDQHALTGESAPVEKRDGNEVYAMTVILAGKLYIKVKESGENTTASKIKRIIQHSAGYKVRVQSTGERIADRAVIPTLGLATLGYYSRGSSASMAIINCDYGTGIRVAAPTALLATLIYAAKNGILIKNGRALESLPKVKTFIFDKTGTLTREVPEVKEIICNDGKFKPEDVLFYTAVTEQRFSHPIAKAILKKAEEENIRLSNRDRAKYNVGFGIEVILNGDIIKVGSNRYMHRERIAIPSFINKKLEGIYIQGGSSVLVAVNDKLAGALELESSHRPEAFDVIQGLRERKVENIVLISGDHEAPTKDLANKLGIDTYYSEILPQDKLRYVKKFQGKNGYVAMVGDGINDSPALSRADVSISLRGASDIATDVADIVFIDGDLSKTNFLYDISTGLKKNVNRSMAMIIIPNTICIIGALFGKFGLVHSLFFNNGANFAATVNGTLPLNGALEEET